MCDSELKSMLTATEMDTRPSPARAQAVRERMMHIAGRTGIRPHRRRNTLVAAVAVIGVSGIGLAATETGRNFIRSMFTPVEELPGVEWEAPDGDVWTHTRTGSGPLSLEEQEEVAKRFSENYASKQAGEGRLVGLIESPGFGGGSETIYLIEYTQSNGETSVVGSGRPTGEQAENMRIDEIMRLRDSGEGEIIGHASHPIGMGQYRIRLTLSDGETVELRTFYPPSTHEERERTFEEMRKLKAALRFTVLEAFLMTTTPEAGVWGNLQYELADGRIVGVTEQVPPEVVSEDGTQVVMPDLNAPIPIEGAEPEPD